MIKTLRGVIRAVSDVARPVVETPSVDLEAGLRPLNTAFSGTPLPTPLPPDSVRPFRARIRSRLRELRAGWTVLRDEEGNLSVPAAPVRWRAVGQVVDSLNRDASPEAVARGVALGAGIGMTPLMGLHTPLVLAVSRFLRVNIPAACAATWITNPVTAAPILFLELKIGRFFCAERPGVTDALVATAIGGAIMASVVAPLAYVLTKHMIAVWKKGRARDI